jgi:hypothetical protein
MKCLVAWVSTMVKRTIGVGFAEGYEPLLCRFVTWVPRHITFIIEAEVNFVYHFE